MKQTLAQKILQKHTDEEITADGQIVNCRLDLVLANDITGPLAIKGFKAILDGECDDMAESDFYMVGDINEARAKCEKRLASE